MSSSMNIIVVDDDNADAEVYILTKGLIQTWVGNYFCVLYSLGPMGRNSFTNKTFKKFNINQIKLFVFPIFNICLRVTCEIICNSIDSRILHFDILFFMQGPMQIPLQV